MQSHSCFRAVPDRTARARGWRRLKQNKQNPQTLRMPTQTKTASQGQRKAKYPLPEWGLLLMPLQLGLSSPLLLQCLSHTSSSVPGSLSHTLGEWRGRAEQALIYGLEVQACPEYLPTSSLTSYEKVLPKGPQISTIPLSVWSCECAMHSPRGAQCHCCSLSQGLPSLKKNKEDLFPRLSLKDALWALRFHNETILRSLFRPCDLT